MKTTVLYTSAILFLVNQQKGKKSESVYTYDPTDLLWSSWWGVGVKHSGENHSNQQHDESAREKPHLKTETYLNIHIVDDQYFCVVVWYINIFIVMCTLIYRRYMWRICRKQSKGKEV
jgi:hypothetical protein